MTEKFTLSAEITLTRKIYVDVKVCVNREAYVDGEVYVAQAIQTVEFTIDGEFFCACVVSSHGVSKAVRRS